MDVDVCGWILEFLTRQISVDDRILNDLIRVLPLPNTSPRLKKSLILRKIDSDIEKGTISERTIEFIEQLEKLDIMEGDAEVSEAMKAAYCTVAMHCTAKFIEENARDKKEKDIGAVRRIWSGRIREMDGSDVAKRVGMAEDDFIRWVHAIDVGVLNVDVCENVLQMFKDLDVVQVLRRYVNEAKEKMGPSFLELACDTILSDDALSKAMGLDEVAELNNQTKDSAPTNDANANANCRGDSNESFRAPALPTHKRVAPGSHRGAGHGTRKGVKIVDPMETSHKTYDHITTPEVSKVQEALKTSSFELHAVVKDPLPDALRLAESFKVSRSGENVAHEHVVGSSTRVNGEAPGPSHDSNDKTQDADGDDVIGRDKEIRIMPSLLERNKTAHTMEWSDSIESSEEGSPTRPHLPSPKKRKFSPSSLSEINKLVRKRKKKRWTTLEEDTLRTGVQKYGRGNWKLILSLHRDIFEDRTEVDLKDKWRNLIRW